MRDENREENCDGLWKEIRSDFREIIADITWSDIREILKKVFTVGVVSKIILVAILMIVHEYTGGGRVITDIREFFIWDDLLCADNFVTLGILILCALLTRDYFLIFKRMFSEYRMGEVCDQEEFNFATDIIQQLEEYRGQKDGKIVQFPTNRRDMYR